MSQKINSTKSKTITGQVQDQGQGKSTSLNTGLTGFTLFEAFTFSKGFLTLELCVFKPSKY
jgi:hypothetical protein